MNAIVAAFPFDFFPGNAFVEMILAGIVFGAIIQLGRLLIGRVDAHSNTEKDRAAVTKETAARPPDDLD